MCNNKLNKVNSNIIINNSEDSANNYDDLCKLKLIDQIPNILVENCCKLNDEEIQQYYNVNNLSRKSSVSHISNPVYCHHSIRSATSVTSIIGATSATSTTTAAATATTSTTNIKNCLYDSCSSLNNNNNFNNINNVNRSRTPLYSSAGSSSLDHSIMTVTSQTNRPNYNNIIPSASDNSSCYSITGTLTNINNSHNNYNYINNNNTNNRMQRNLSCSMRGSMSSVYEYNWEYNNKDNSCCTNMILTPSKITIEPMSSSSLCSDIPEYFNSPSRIKWNFLAGLDEREKLEDEDLHVEIQEHNQETNIITTDINNDDELIRKQSPDIKTVSIWRTENDEANAIIFHHESEIVENCCNNYIQCNMYLDQNYTDECSSGYCDFLSKTNTNTNTNNSNNNQNNNQNNNNNNNNLQKLNNTTSEQTSYPASITISHRNDFTTQNIRNGSPDFRRFEKRTNLNQNIVNFAQIPGSSSSSTSNILTVLNKSTNTSVNNLNYNQNLEVNLLNEDKPLNLLRNNINQIANTNYLRSTGLSGTGSGVSSGGNVGVSGSTVEYSGVQVGGSSGHSSHMMLEPYSITTTTSSQYEKPFYLTTQNQFYPYLNSDRRQSINLSHGSHLNINNININQNNNNNINNSINNNNNNNNSINNINNINNNNMTPVQLQRWQSLTNTIGLGELIRIVRSRARKCAEYLRGDVEKNREH